MPAPSRIAHRAIFHARKHRGCVPAAGRVARFFEGGVHRDEELRATLPGFDAGVPVGTEIL
jgi:hypothetical protein